MFVGKELCHKVRSAYTAVKMQCIIQYPCLHPSSISQYLRTSTYLVVVVADAYGHQYYIDTYTYLFSIFTFHTFNFMLIYLCFTWRYANVPAAKAFEFGYRMGGPEHTRERHHRTKGIQSKIKENWEHENGDTGDHYWEYNHNSREDDTDEHKSKKTKQKSRETEDDEWDISFCNLKRNMLLVNHHFINHLSIFCVYKYCTLFF